MILQNLRLYNFRVYPDQTFKFNERLNIIHGDNGSGKTSLLEAIHVLALTKSFRVNNDRLLVRDSEPYFQVFGDFLDDSRGSHSVNVNYQKGEGKKIFWDRQTLPRKTDIVGKIPLIILSPATQRITEGGPALRRDFMNRIIAQINPEYFLALLDYNRRVFQRNRLLSEFNAKGQLRYTEYLEAMDELILRSAAVLHTGRIDFIERFAPLFQERFQEIFHNHQTVDIGIQYNGYSDQGNDYRDTLQKKLKQKIKSDIHFMRTSCGPHLDHLVIQMDKREIRQVASQGEHKVVLVALKMAESRILEESLEETVIFLLDDLFAMLDLRHCVNIVNEISQRNQTFITTTDYDSLKEYGVQDENTALSVLQLPVGEA